MTKRVGAEKAGPYLGALVRDVCCHCHIDTAPPISVVPADGELCAIDDTRPRRSAALRCGRPKGCPVGCPLYAASFDLVAEEAAAL
ncbi:hypothetical protein [Streptomyces chattanoogensis]|uniref:hypothetical protein n=1 Tax=Streptomyces chattanoogensis TaxID=66876 RepID=UPI0005D8E7FE|nr:hypothetical protein T261_7395 [Streptomyces lydicus]